MTKFVCPFCQFKAEDDYFLFQHIELIHPEDENSPFLVKDTDPSFIQSSFGNNEDTSPLSITRSLLATMESADPDYVECTYPGCGEAMPSTPAEIQSHTDLHLAERMAIEEANVSVGPEDRNDIYDKSNELKDTVNRSTTPLADAVRNHNQPDLRTLPKGGHQSRTSLKDLLLGLVDSSRTERPVSQVAVADGAARRLGKAELGPYAHEKRMPASLQRKLEEGANVMVENSISPKGTITKVEVIANETPDLVPVLARLSSLDSTVKRAFYCNPHVRHICKMKDEGGFCGYRNIQMLISCIRGARSDGWQQFQDQIPSILELQDLIEKAWDKGFNSAGRIETGGIRYTRKYIGTPEAQALFLGLSIGCEALAFTRYTNKISHESLLQSVHNYFASASSVDYLGNVHITNRPPIYFQHQGHSMTIVGFEIRKCGAVNLVVFDPMFNASPAMKRLARMSGSFQIKDPKKLLKAHRRGESYLSRYKEFEILKLTGKDFNVAPPLDSTEAIEAAFERYEARMAADAKIAAEAKK